MVVAVKVELPLTQILVKVAEVLIVGVTLGSVLMVRLLLRTESRETQVEVLISSHVTTEVSLNW